MEATHFIFSIYPKAWLYANRLLNIKIDTARKYEMNNRL